MKVVLIGATGNAGSRLLTELAQRGHAVTAIARHPEKILARQDVTAKRGDVSDKAEAQAGGVFLDTLREETDLDWTFLCPSAVFVAGERTGRFRLGEDRLLADTTGKSSISFEDFAIAMVDELERPAHARRRFTVGY